MPLTTGYKEAEQVVVHIDGDLADFYNTPALAPTSDVFLTRLNYLRAIRTHCELLEEIIRQRGHV